LTRINKNIFNEYKAFASNIIMLFRNSDGKLVELNRYDYKNDRIYYKNILLLKNIVNHPKEVISSVVAIQKSILQKE
jgi:hypothetical protein